MSKCKWIYIDEDYLNSLRKIERKREKGRKTVKIYIIKVKKGQKQ